MLTTHDRVLAFFVVCSILLVMLMAFLSNGIVPAITGFWHLQISPARLISDFTMIANPGAALLNVAMVGILGLVVLWLNRIQLSGPSVAAIFTMMGFAFFGKTILNCIPVIIGVSISALIVRKKPKEYVLIALFGTALGPIVSFIAFELGFPAGMALPLSFIIGVVVGIVLPPIAIAMLHLHQGYNLYNIGLTAGFIGLFAASIPNAGGVDISTLTSWNTEKNIWLFLLIPMIAFLALVISLISGPNNSIKEFLKIQKMSGRLPSDFTELAGKGGALANAGLLTILYWFFMRIIGAPCNGPVVGGLFTILGFSLFGKNIVNNIPVALGILFGVILFGKSIVAPWVILAILFGTALSPIAGEFGFGAGFLAGFLHLVLVERTSAWHAGINLYNNGFSAGLVATLIVSVLEWYKTNREL